MLSQTQFDYLFFKAYPLLFLFSQICDDLVALVDQIRVETFRCVRQLLRRKVLFLFIRFILGTTVRRIHARAGE